MPYLDNLLPYFVLSTHGALGSPYVDLVPYDKSQQDLEKVY